MYLHTISCIMQYMPLWDTLKKRIKNEMISLSNNAEAHMNNKVCRSQITNNQRTYQEQIVRQISVLLKLRLKRQRDFTVLFSSPDMLQLRSWGISGWGINLVQAWRLELDMRCAPLWKRINSIVSKSYSIVYCSRLLASPMSLLSSYFYHWAFFPHLVDVYIQSDLKYKNWDRIQPRSWRIGVKDPSSSSSSVQGFDLTSLYYH